MDYGAVWVIYKRYGYEGFDFGSTRNFVTSCAEVSSG